MGNYPKYRKKDDSGKWMVVGTFHAYLPDLDLDLRGIHYIYKKGKIFIRYPSKKGIIDNKECDYLVFSFCSNEKQQALTYALKGAMIAFSKTPDFEKTCPNICTK